MKKLSILSLGLSILAMAMILAVTLGCGGGGAVGGVGGGAGRRQAQVVVNSIYHVASGDDQQIPVVMQAGDSLSINVSVRSNDISLSVYAPSGASLLAPSRVSSANYSVTTDQSGTHSVWLDNRYSLLTDKDVTVSITLMPK